MHEKSLQQIKKKNSFFFFARILFKSVSFLFLLFSTLVLNKTMLEKEEKFHFGTVVFR